jgi:formate hydrogenlyase transcriptional activator
MPEATDKINFEKLITELSTDFINLPFSEIDEKIVSGFKSISRFLKVERIALLQFSEDNKHLFLTHSYAEKSSQDASKFLVSKDLPWFSGSIREGKILRISKLDDIPDDALPERRYAKKQGMKGFLTIPLIVAGSVSGGISYSSMTNERIWSDEMVQRFILINEIFANALDRRNKDQSLGEAYKKIKILQGQLEHENAYLREEIKLRHNHDEIIGSSDALLNVLHQSEKVAVTDSTVLILGETGTGKELLARTIHKLSPYRNKTMIKVNCAALPSTLIEGELFGREKGAYTGALSKEIGRFELADNSTIFLDEISEISFDLQAKLLRVLQEGQFERLGSSRTISVDVRIIAATNRDLATMLKNREFREDLYYRLNVFPITMPPLRERVEDIPVLVWHFVKELESSMAIRVESIPQNNMLLLQSYPWPGNIRELRNVVEQAMILSPGKVLQVKPPHFRETIKGADLNLDNTIRNKITEALDVSGWRVSGKNGAAELLGLKPTTLYSKINKTGIKRP